MCSKNIGFLLTLVFASATCVASAASSVRVLGTNNLNNSNNVSAVTRSTDSASKTRKASLPLKKTFTASTNKEESNKPIRHLVVYLL